MRIEKKASEAAKRKFKNGFIHGKSRKVINIITNIIYNSTAEAYKNENIEVKDRHFRDILKNKYGGTTDLLYLDDYQKITSNN